MTQDEFLDDYVPRVLRPMGGWDVLGNENVIRLDGRCCPLTAASGEPSTFYATAFDEAYRLGIDYELASQIMSAADNKPQHRSEVRARLLAGLGLSEPR